jgi:hypothetical protein
MRNNKVIDPSLNKKIVENEKRMQHLFKREFSLSKSKNNIKKPSNSQTKLRNVHHKKTKSQDEIYNKDYNTIDNRDINRLKGAFNVTISKTIEKGDDNDSSAFTNRMAKRMNQKKQAEEEKNNKTFHDTINNIYQKFQERKNKNRKVYNQGQVNDIVDRLYTNDYKTKKKANKENRTNRHRKEFEKDNNTIDFSIKTGSNGNIMKRQIDPSNVNIDDMIERFEEDMKKRDENLKRKKREIKRNEKKIYTYMPKINETSRRSESAGKDDFFSRQKRYEEKKKKKEEKFKENLKNEEEKKINENNFLLQKNNRKEKKGKKGKKDKKDENEKNDKNKSENIKKKEEVDKRIQYMYDWENKRKEKIENKMKEKTGQAETEFNHMPKINERSSSMANKSRRRKEEPDVFSRLAKEDKMLKEKRQVLIDLYKPTFQPNTFLHSQKIRKNSEYEAKKEVKKKEEPKSESSSDSDSDSDDDDDDDDDGEDNNEESSSSDSDDKEDNFDYKQDPKKFAEDNVQDAIRKALFNKKKK